ARARWVALLAPPPTPCLVSPCLSGGSLPPHAPPLREDYPRRERGADDQQRRRAASAALLLLLLRTRLRRSGRGRGRGVLAPGARRDQARLQLAKEGGVGRELLGQPVADPVAPAGGALREPLQPVSASIDAEGDLRHFFGGGSAVATRQTFAAACRAATMAPALSPIQSALRSMPGCLPVCDWPKPAGYCNSMDKAERQRLIASVVSRRRVGSQHELA